MRLLGNQAARENDGKGLWDILGYQTGTDNFCTLQMKICPKCCCVKRIKSSGHQASNET